MNDVVTVNDRHFRLYMTAAEIDAIVKRLSDEISRDMADLDPIVCPILSGSFMFAADLLRQLSFSPEVQFVKYSSYSGLASSGNVREVLGFSPKVKGRHVLLVEDIVETGISMHYTMQRLQELQPASVSICTFVHKPELLQCDIPLKYIGRNIGNDFIVGYGLDYNDHGRCFPDIYVLDTEQ